MSVIEGLRAVAGRMADKYQQGNYRQSKYLRMGLVVAAAALAVGIFQSLRMEPELLDRIETGPLLLLVFVGAPISILVNAWEFRLMARAMDKDIGMASAAKVTVVGTAANLLPIPGGVAARIGGLKLLGVDLKAGASISLLMALAWIGMALVASGIAFSALGMQMLALVFTASGLAIIVAAILPVLRSGASTRVVAGLVLIKAFLVLIDGARMYVAVTVLGGAVGLIGALMFAGASVAGSAFTLVPAGLGIREIVSAGIGAIVGVPPQIAFMAAFVNRLAGLVIVLPAALVMAATTRSGPSEPPA